MIFKRKKGEKDIQEAITNIRLPLYLARSDIRQRYRRSSLGPFWITISTGVMIVCLGMIFGTIYQTSLSNFLPFVALGLIIWSFISICINEATSVFAHAESIIKQLPIPLFTHVLRMVFRNFFIFLHNILLYPVILICAQLRPNWVYLLVLPGLVILVLNLLWISLLIAIICSRFRDLSQIVASVLQVFFYVTPIIWMPNMLKGNVNHLIEIVRSPLMGILPSTLNWIVCITMFFIGSIFTIGLFNKYRGRIAYWL